MENELQCASCGEMAVKQFSSQTMCEECGVKEAIRDKVQKENGGEDKEEPSGLVKRWAAHESNRDLFIASEENEHTD